MAGATLDEMVRDEHEAAGEGKEDYDILILDAGYKQSLTSARSLGRTGLRIALGESVGQYAPSHQPPAFRSVHCALSVPLPDYNTDPGAFVDAIVAFVRDHHIRVVLPTGDASITVLAPHRDRFTALGCTLAVASDSALEIANDKTRTLEVASKLGIAYPKSVHVSCIEDLRTAEAEFGYPFVLKPTISWTGKVADRVVPCEVINEAEATEAATRYLATGCDVIAQQLATGRREGVTLFIADGQVLASCGAVAHRTTPPLGGVSVMRESIAVPDEVLDASIRLATTIGVEGACEVEFRRDADGNPLLMEINPRLAGSLENAIKSGVNVPLLVWQWASGQPIEPVRSYRAGVRTRWLAGDLRWVWDNTWRSGRPDSMPQARGIWTFLWEFVRTRHYDYVDRRDIRPAIAEVWDTAGIMRKHWVNRKQWRDDRKQSNQ
jgi:predicted ATP-grasp superfamily ATP-dependent carboligase